MFLLLSNNAVKFLIKKYVVEIFCIILWNIRILFKVKK